MKIAVTGNAGRISELKDGLTDIEFVEAKRFEALWEIDDADAYFLLADEGAVEWSHRITKPIFIHSVTATLTELKAPANTIRINAWKGFLSRNTWEIAGEGNAETNAILQAMKKTGVAVPDTPGFISARIIAMIINEAFFAKEENVSTEKEIDIAMKLGTSYPKGPFEWAEEIGINHIITLLNKLAETDIRYKAANALTNAADHS